MTDLPTADDMGFLYAMQGAPDYWEGKFADDQFTVELWGPGFTEVDFWMVRVFDHALLDIKSPEPTFWTADPVVEFTKGQPGYWARTPHDAFRYAATTIANHVHAHRSTG